MKSFLAHVAIAGLLASPAATAHSGAGVSGPIADDVATAQLARASAIGVAASDATNLENPYPGAHVSGIGLVSGWTCRTGVVEVSFDGGPRDNLVPSGGSRADTAPVCGRSDTGFGLLFNYNLLGSGNHTVELFVDGVQVGSAVPFTVTVPAGEFITGVSRTVDVTDFPDSGRTTRLEWQQSTQNFAITGVSGGTELVRISTQNQVAVARATFANFVSLGYVGDLPVSSPAGAAMAGASIGVARRALGLAHNTTRTADARVRPLAVYSMTEDCLFGGSVTLTIDDRDNNGVPSYGDVMTMTFNDCREDWSSSVDGSFTVNIAVASATQLSGLFTFNRLEAVVDGYTAAVNGVADVVYSETSDVSGTRMMTDMTVAPAGLVSSGSNPSYSDTFTYDPGFRAVWTDVIPFAPTAEPYSTAVLNGRLHAASLNGRIIVATDATAPVHDWWSEMYPDSGRVTVDGYRSHLRLTVISTMTVRLELDANDDGVIESTVNVPWATLMP